MGGFGLDEEAGGAPVPPPRHGGKVVAPARPRRKAKTSSKPRIIQVRLSEEDGEVTLLTRPPGRGLPRTAVYVAVNDIDKVLTILRRQLEGGGVAFQPERTQLGVYFSQRDSLWQARARGPNGELRRRGFAVPRYGQTKDGRRRPITEAEFQKQKQATLAEAEQWQADVRSGAIL